MQNFFGKQFFMDATQHTAFVHVQSISFVHVQGTSFVHVQVLLLFMCKVLLLFMCKEGTYLFSSKGAVVTFELQHDKTIKITFAPNADSDRLGIHPA